MLASLVHRILQGANPAELPVEQPTRYQFSINMTAARALKLQIPARLAASADSIIE